jgi:WD40 repeat protein
LLWRQGHTGEVNRVAFSGDGSQVASCSDDRSVRIWDVASGECRATLEVVWCVYIGCVYIGCTVRFSQLPTM